MADFRQIDEARKILGLDKEASLMEIKSAFRKLTLKYHPDKCGKENRKNCEETFKKIKRAKDIIEGYCLNYQISFGEKEVRKNAASRDEIEHSERFYDGWF